MLPAACVLCVCSGAGWIVTGPWAAARRKFLGIECNGKSVPPGATDQSIRIPRVLLRGTEPTDDWPLTVRPASSEASGPGSGRDRYEILGEIARGGMGAILRGRDSDLGRDIAIKVLLDKHRDHPEFVRRFFDEAQIGGQLQHPGIVPVYELGQFGDLLPYFAMKLVEGRTLAVLLAGHRKSHMTWRGSWTSSSKSARRWPTRTLGA